VVAPALAGGAQVSEARERRLIVTWKSDASKGILPVAELIIQAVEPRYSFGYLEGVREALNYGFQPFLAFPKLETRYESETLFPFFANRVLPTTRPDYLESLTAVGLDVQDVSIAEVLGRTNGRRATDRIETILVPIPSALGRYRTHFFLRGVNHSLGAETIIARLDPDELLTLVKDTSNDYNPHARQLHARGHRLGYVPDYLVNDLNALESRCRAGRARRASQPAPATRSLSATVPNRLRMAPRLRSLSRSPALTIR
jgi:hypothetical protein